MADSSVTVVIPIAALCAILFALWLWKRVSGVKLSVKLRPRDSYLLEEEQRGEDEVVNAATDIQSAISEGANSFLITEYRYLAVFMVHWPVCCLVGLGIF